MTEGRNYEKPEVDETPEVGKKWRMQRSYDRLIHGVACRDGLEEVQARKSKVTRKQHKQGRDTETLFLCLVNS
jgi:hypothetical protein